MDRFIARENIKHYRRELENGLNEPTRTTMLRLLVEEENHLGLTHEQLAKLDGHISRLSEIMARLAQSRGLDPLYISGICRQAYSRATANCG